MSNDTNKCPNCKSEMRLYHKVYRDLGDSRTGNIYDCNICKRKYEKVLGSRKFIFNEVISDE